ncbi:hypothetical protein [Parasphingopyxis marina]|uniref:Lipoprotein n=1 Tax=Parasphingopyxis marina TaxID=2761622 RepID=A0A842HYR6_9SPHN|nr:hypothetical protein [Parasphingopyxis marina]MBC2777573.1 hypothetical protein [Parasphingopyxis marina]
MKRIILTLMMAATSACATPSAEPTREDGMARLGDTIFVDGPNVMPIQVIEDSRCPRGTACVWEGRVVLRVEVTGGAWAQTMDLVSGEPQQVADGALTLVSVLPEAGSGEPLPESYRFAFEFDGGL